MINQKPFYLLEKEYCQRMTSQMQSMGPEKVKAALLDLSEITSDDIMSVKDGQADILISGPLSKGGRDIMSLLFGGVSYNAILDALNRAENDDSVKSVNLIIDSPGGEVAGVDLVAVALKQMSKPTVARVENLCASAAYWIASQADSIIAMSPSVEVGSIGIIVSYLDDTEAMEKEGIKEYVLTSVEAPHKHTEVATNGGRQLLIDRLNAIHNVFASRVAEGRGITTQQVNATYGKGDLLIASSALEAGMIDAIENDLDKGTQQVIHVEVEEPKESVTASISGNDSGKCDIVAHKVLDTKPNIGVGSMEDEKKLVAEAKEAGLKDGILAERKRIASLREWEKHNPETGSVVEEAISAGKSAEEVMPQLMSAIKQTSYKVAAEEGAENDVSPATETDPAPASEEEAESEESEELSDKGSEVASAIAKSIIKGGNF